MTLWNLGVLTRYLGLVRIFISATYVNLVTVSSNSIILQLKVICSQVTSLAFATRFNLLYWVVADEQFVGVTDFKKGRSIKVINSSLDIPYSVAVYEAKRLMS